MKSFALSPSVAGIRGHYHESSDCFEYPPQKIPSQLEPPKIIPESKISNPPKTFDHLRHLNSGFPSPPLSTPLGFSLALSQSIGATW